MAEPQTPYQRKFTGWKQEQAEYRTALLQRLRDAIDEGYFVDDKEYSMEGINIDYQGARKDIKTFIRDLMREGGWPNIVKISLSPPGRGMVDVEIFFE